MAVLRPLVREKGRTRQWRVADALAGVPAVRVWLKDNTLVRVPLDENGELVIMLKAGTRTAVPVVGGVNGR